jgi:hypothetical protein
MKEVIRIGEVVQESKKAVEFTHVKNDNGWVECTVLPSDSNTKKVVYLGYSSGDGDMFAAYSLSWIFIYKGHLNSGKY